MSKITVNVDADGQPESFTFDWTGTLQDWKGLVDAVAILAQRKGCDPEQLPLRYRTPSSTRSTSQPSASHRHLNPSSAVA
jgi:hypothetical protein